MSYKIKISDELLRKIHQYQHDVQENIDEGIEIKANKKKLKRIYFLLQKRKGIPNKEIANRLNISADSVSKWARCFCETDIDTFLDIKLTGGIKSELDDFVMEIKVFTTRNKSDLVTIKELQEYLEREFSISKSYNWLTRYCKRNDIPVRNKRIYVRIEWDGELFEFQKNSYKYFVKKVKERYNQKKTLKGYELKNVPLLLRGGADANPEIKRLFTLLRKGEFDATSNSKGLFPRKKTS
ncbi:MAG: hypothetical protein COC22_01330 [Flavobacteriaceae bacterium]|nr:MAG: hypothetical protein COC22_01330 [Flavobacteriaceae bacterium]